MKEKTPPPVSLELLTDQKIKYLNVKLTPPPSEKKMIKTLKQNKKQVEK